MGWAAADLSQWGECGSDDVLAKGDTNNNIAIRMCVWEGAFVAQSFQIRVSLKMHI